MDRNHAWSALNHVWNKSAEPAPGLEQLVLDNLKSEARGDVGRLALLGLGTGVGAAGLVGLYKTLRRNLGRPRKTRSGPAEMPLPYPVLPSVSPEHLGSKVGMVTSKPGLWWYMPAMMAAGMGGLYAGWKGTNSVLKQQQRAATQAELDEARQQFHDVLLSQYPKPYPEDPEEKAKKVKKVAALDQLYAKFEKAAIPFLSDNVPGYLMGGYATTAGLAALMSGLAVYNQVKKRSHRAVLEKALQRRARRKFTDSPSEMYAVPEPMGTVPKPSFHDEMAMLQPTANSGG